MSKDLEFPIETVKELVDMIARNALLIPLADAERLVGEFSHMHAFMPIVDPTAYRDILDTIDGHEDLARAFLAFRRELARIIKDNMP